MFIYALYSLLGLPLAHILLFHFLLLLLLINQIISSQVPPYYDFYLDKPMNTISIFTLPSLLFPVLHSINTICVT